MCHHCPPGSASPGLLWLPQCKQHATAPEGIKKSKINRPKLAVGGGELRPQLWTDSNVFTASLVKDRRPTLTSEIAEVASGSCRGATWGGGADQHPLGSPTSSRAAVTPEDILMTCGAPGSSDCGSSRKTCVEKTEIPEMITDFQFSLNVKWTGAVNGNKLPTLISDWHDNCVNCQKNWHWALVRGHRETPAFTLCVCVQSSGSLDMRQKCFISWAGYVFIIHAGQGEAGSMSQHWCFFNPLAFINDLKAIMNLIMPLSIPDSWKLARRSALCLWNRGFCRTMASNSKQSSINVVRQQNHWPWEEPSDSDVVDLICSTLS